jgi:hypothetical protein
VHSLGQEDVTRIKREMEAIKEKVGSPKEEDLKTFMEKIKADPRFYYPTGTTIVPFLLFYHSVCSVSRLAVCVCSGVAPDILCKGEDIIQEYRRILKEAEGKLSQYFNILPKAPYDIRYVAFIHILKTRHVGLDVVESHTRCAWTQSGRGLPGAGFASCPLLSTASACASTYHAY